MNSHEQRKDALNCAQSVANATGCRTWLWLCPKRGRWIYTMSEPPSRATSPEEVKPQPKA